eukprot:Tamp_19664.p2 GENE.Tamp_19664~~Tamp_19664.p2  ORF type:complete len:133 (+),score=7.16 Tamp_19664:631-1029(+)
MEQHLFSCRTQASVGGRCRSKDKHRSPVSSKRSVSKISAPSLSALDISTLRWFLVQGVRWCKKLIRNSVERDGGALRHDDLWHNLVDFSSALRLYTMHSFRAPGWDPVTSWVPLRPCWCCVQFVKRASQAVE